MNSAPKSTDKVDGLHNTQINGYGHDASDVDTPMFSYGKAPVYESEKSRRKEEKRRTKEEKRSKKRRKIEREASVEL